MYSTRSNIKHALSRAASIVIVVIVIILIIGGAYAALTLGKTSTTSPTTSTSTTQTTTSSSTSQTITSTSTSQTTTSSTTSSTTATVPNPNKIVYETSNQPSSLDPALWSDAGSATIQFNVYETLLQYYGNNSAQVVPWLAQNYTVSSDGLTYTVNLRKGITFQDGSSFNASAVVFSFDRVILMDSSSSNVWILVGSQAPGLINGSFYYSHNFGSGAATYNQSQVNAFINSNGVVVGTNPYQVIFHLGYPDASFPYILALTVASIVSPDYVISHWTPATDGHGYISGVNAGEEDQWMNSHTSGTGPYETVSWSQTTGNVVLKANQNYWGSPFNTGVAKVSEIDLNFVQSDSARVLDLKSGAADIADVPTSDYFAFINKNSWLTSGQVLTTAPGIVAPGPYPQLNIEYIGMNFKIYDPNDSLSGTVSYSIDHSDGLRITGIEA